MRLGTSSPKMMVTKVMMATTMAVAATPAKRAGHAVALQPRRQRGAERGLADDAVEHADGRDAHLHGRQELGRMLQQRSAAAAPLSPSSAMARRRALRLEASASSDIANTPLSTSAARSAGNPWDRGENPTRWDCI
jgi:hypothetical protein